MKITELLKKLDEKYPYKYPQFQLCGDGSGSIEVNGADIVEWNNIEDMKFKLTQLWNDLTNEQETWEL